MLEWLFGSANINLYHLCLNPKISTARKIDKINQYLRRGGDINFVNSEVTHCNVLIALTREPHYDLELIRYLLDHGIAIEYRQFSALHTAIEHYHPALVSLYLEYGADLYFENKYSNSWLNYLFHPQPSHEYSTEERRCILDLLLAAKLDLNRPLHFWLSGELSLPLEVLCHEKEKELLQYVLAVSSHPPHSPLHLTNSPVMRTVIFEQDFWGLESFILLAQQVPQYIQPDFVAAPDNNGSEHANLLALTVYGNAPQCCHYLLEHFPQLRGELRQRSLMLAALDHHFPLPVLEKLLSVCGDINRRYPLAKEEGVSAPLLLMFLNRLGHWMQDESRVGYLGEVLALLLRRGADLNADLISHGKPYEMLSYSALRLLCYAMLDSGQLRPDWFALCLTHGLDLNRKFGPIQEPSLMSIVQRGTDMDQSLLIQMLEYLCHKGLDLTAVNCYGTNYVSAAAIACRNDLLRWFIAQGGDIHHHCGHDNSPILHKAISTYWQVEISGQRRQETVALLLQQGAQLEEFSVDEQFTPLMCACYYGAQSCVALLLEHGANPNACNADGNTPALCTVLGGESIEFPRFESTAARIIDLLRHYGADLEVRNHAGDSVLNAIMSHDHKELFESVLARAAFSDAYLSDAQQSAEPDTYFDRRLHQYTAQTSLSG